MQSAFAWYMRSHVGRMLTRYGQRSGVVLAGGTAYAALFSVFGALVAGFSIFGLLLGNNDALFNQVVRATADALPGLLTVDGSKGAIDPKTLVRSNLFSTTGIIAFLIALWGGLGWVDALRNGVRTMFDVPFDDRFILVKKVADVVWLASLGVTLLLSAIASLALTSISEPLLDALNVGGTLANVLTRVLGFAVVSLVDAVVLLIVFKWLSRLRLPFVVLRGPILLGGVLLAALSQFGGLFIGSAAARNPILATGALLVTLLLLFDLMSRVMLYLAAWIATRDVEGPREHGPVEAVDLTKDVPDPNAIAPTVSVRAQDRTVLAAGVTLGAALAVAGRVLVEGGRTVRELVRRN